MRWNAALGALAASWGLIAVLAASVDLGAESLAFWRLALIKKQRLDLLEHTTYFNAKTIDPATIPNGALLFVTIDDKLLLDQVATGGLREVFRAPEPADDPVFFVLEKPGR